MFACLISKNKLNGKQNAEIKTKTYEEKSAEYNRIKNRIFNTTNETSATTTDSSVNNKTQNEPSTNAAAATTTTSSTSNQSGTKQQQPSQQFTILNRHSSANENSKNIASDPNRHISTTNKASYTNMSANLNGKTSYSHRQKRYSPPPPASAPSASTTSTLSTRASHLTSNSAVNATGMRQPQQQSIHHHHLAQQYAGTHSSLGFSHHQHQQNNQQHTPLAQFKSMQYQNQHQTVAPTNQHNANSNNNNYPTNNNKLGQYNPHQMVQMETNLVASAHTPPPHLLQQQQAWVMQKSYSKFPMNRQFNAE